MSDLPKFEHLPNVGNVVSNNVTAFNQGYNLYQCINYLQGYVSIVYNSMDELLDDWNNFKTYITEQLEPLVDDATKEILNQWLTDGTIESMLSENLQKPNILINSDFKSGIINQKGLAYYSNGSEERLQLHEDMWLLMGINAYSGKGVIGLTFGANENQIFVIQKINPLQAGKYHAYVNLQSLKGTAKLYLKKHTSTYKTEMKTLTNGENKFVFDVTGEVDSLQILLEPNSEIEVLQIKLEVGDVFTGMPLWNYNKELMKCQRFLQVFTQSDIIIFDGVGSSTSYVLLPLSIALNKSPTVDGLINQKVKTTTSGGQVTTTITNVSLSKKTPSGLLLALDVADYTNMESYKPVIFELKPTGNVILDANEY